jgi:hypothetical protein
MCIRRVGQSRIYTVYIQYFWQGSHQKRGHIRCIYAVLANSMHTQFWPSKRVHEIKGQPIHFQSSQDSPTS